MVLAFNGGGYFAGVTGAVAAALGLVLVLRLTLADEPFAGLGRMAIAAAAALGLFAGLVLASAIWSDAPARAMIEFDRALLYWLALFLFASLGYSIRRLAWATRLVALAILAICAISLTTRLLPDLLATQEGFEIERLSYPLTYWNALGLLASLGTLLCFHLTASEHEPGPVRVAAAAALPVLAGCLFFTFSRGAVAALALGLVLYVLAARPYALLSALLATAPAVAVVLVSAYDAEALSGDNPTSPLAVDQGGDVALVVALCVVGAGALRWLLLLLDARVGAALSRRRPSRRMAIAGVGMAAAVLVAASIASGLPGWLEKQYDRFLEGSPVSSSGDLRARFTEVGNNGRLDQWRVARDAFESKPLAGEGAGTFPEIWSRDRTIDLKVEDAHSLYLEVLAELGVIGLALLLITLGLLVAGIARRMKGDGRHLHAALLSALVVWAAHAGIDWDWEVPALGLWLFALGGLALAKPVGAPGAGPGRFSRVALSIGVLALLVTPATMAFSQNRLNAAAHVVQAGRLRGGHRSRAGCDRGGARAAGALPAARRVRCPSGPERACRAPAPDGRGEEPRRLDLLVRAGPGPSHRRSGPASRDRRGQPAQSARADRGRRPGTPSAQGGPDNGEGGHSRPAFPFSRPTRPVGVR